MDLTKKVKVWNRSSGKISYEIPELRARKEWTVVGALQQVSVEELQALRYMPGGAKLMDKYMLIKDQDVCEFLGMATDPEYFYDENDIKVLLEKGTMDQLLDCLEFAPAGVLEILRQIAVDSKLDSSEKRRVISEHLKVNIDAMIKNNEVDGAEVVDTSVKQRRSTPVKAEADAPKYNVTKRG